MNTNIGTSDGLNVYRELINKESAGNANWYVRFRGSDDGGTLKTPP